jgi:hypothetical protein
MPTYVQHKVLKNFSDVFNAAAIWQAPGLALFNRKPTLRDLLERNPREHRGRTATRCFSHVTLTLPREEIDDDYHLTRGNRARELVQALKQLHQKDFGDLLNGEEIRYQVLPDDALGVGEIGVKFGHAVYLPANEDSLQYHITSSTDSVIWNTVCPIYSKQRLALIAGDSALASFQTPDWPFAADAAILLINDGPNSVLELQARPKEAFDCRYDAHKGYYTISAKAGVADDHFGRAPRLLLKLTKMSAPRTNTPSARAANAQSMQSAPARTAPTNIAATTVAEKIAASFATVAAAAQAIRSGSTPAPTLTPLSGTAKQAAPQGVWKPRPLAQVAALAAVPALHDPDQTALPMARRSAVPQNDGDRTYAPLAQQRFKVSLVALALPRLASYRQTKVQTLSIGFTRALAIAGAQTAGARAISFEVNANDQLTVCTPAGRQQISAPASFNPFDTQEIRLLACPAEMAERYCGTLCLPQALTLPLATGGRYGFGRGIPTLAALRVLDSPQFLSMDAGASAQDCASADRIGLSRHAFSYEAAADGFLILREAAAQALYHLAQDLRFVAKIESARYSLPSGHHLVAGHYVLRFDAATGMTA